MEVSTKFAERQTQREEGLWSADSRPLSSLQDLKTDILTPGCGVDSTGELRQLQPQASSPPPESATSSPTAPRSGTCAEAHDVWRAQALSKARENQPGSLEAPRGLPSAPTTLPTPHKVLCTGLKIWSALIGSFFRAGCPQDTRVPLWPTALASPEQLPSGRGRRDEEGQGAELLGLHTGRPQTPGLNTTPISSFTLLEIKVSAELVLSEARGESPSQASLPAPEGHLRALVSLRSLLLHGLLLCLSVHPHLFL